MKNSGKKTFWFLVIVLIVITWLFDFSSWAKENIELIIAVMVGSVIGGIWWIADKLKEIEEIIKNKF